MKRFFPSEILLQKITYLKKRFSSNFSTMFDIDLLPKRLNIMK